MYTEIYIQAFKLNHHIVCRSGLRHVSTQIVATAADAQKHTQKARCQSSQEFFFC